MAAIAASTVFGDKHRTHLIRLATEPDDEHAGEIRMPHITADGTAQLLNAFAVMVDAATEAVRDRDNAVDVRPRIQRAWRREMLRDQFRHRRRAVDGANHANVVARRHATVSATKALECQRVLREIAHGNVLRMNVRAGLDRLRGESDDLAVAPHRVSSLQRAQCHLVRSRNIVDDDEAVQLMQHGACGDRTTRDCDVIVAMQRDDQ
jgi:hypothetical protein